MNLHVDFNRVEKELHHPLEVQLGKVYSWGAMQVHYLRVDGGSVCLNTWDFIPDTHEHFGKSGPRVELAIANNLTLRYEG
jgi:hypothetical protein